MLEFWAVEAESRWSSQRAFRARKERHVKDLEKKLSEIESSATTLASDNQRLKLALQRLMTENEILRSTPVSGRPAQQRMGKKPAPAENLQGKDGDKGKAAAEPTAIQSPNARGLGEKTAGSNILSMSDAWDFLIEHPLVKEGLVDITDASCRLRQAAKPGPQGPVFRKGEAQTAIELARRGGGDALA
jgi:AP-1-like transcription factor